MLRRLLVLTFAATFAPGCQAATAPVAQQTPTKAAAAAPPPAPAREDVARAEPPLAETEAAGLAAEPAPAPPPAETEAVRPSVTAAQPAAEATPARFATTQSTTAPATVVERPVVIVPTTSEASEALAVRPTPLNAAQQFDEEYGAGGPDG